MCDVLCTRRAALALSLQRTLEESTYFAFNYCSFVPRDVFMTQQPIIFHDFGPPLRGIVAAVFRRKILRDLHGQARSLTLCNPCRAGFLSARTGSVCCGAAHCSDCCPWQGR